MQYSKGRILCTEDDPDTREMIILLLNQEGYDVTCTDNPHEAISIISKESYDLILVDNWMPEMSGNDLTRKLRSFNQSTPILFYSGAAYEADKQVAFAAGAQGYLVKPEGVYELAAEVARLIAEAKIAFPVAIELPLQEH